jgi:ankyrin repeat protein
LPLLPESTPPADTTATSAPTEAKPETVATETKPAGNNQGKKKHHRVMAGAASSARHASGTGNYFRSERLPATIYKKVYDANNKHLPAAYYEKEFSGLVFVTAQHDDLNGLRGVLDAGRDMELVDRDGDTPLLVAVKHNAINAVRLLLARHANYNVTDRSGMTPLQIAQRQGNFQIVRAIEAAGASIAQE